MYICLNLVHTYYLFSTEFIHSETNPPHTHLLIITMKQNKNAKNNIKTK